MGVPLAPVACIACAGIDARRDRIAVRAGSATLAALLAGYCAVCVLSPYDIRWQTEAALYRLPIQLWPATLFLASSLRALTAAIEVRRAVEPRTE